MRDAELQDLQERLSDESATIMQTAARAIRLLRGKVERLEADIDIPRGSDYLAARMAECFDIAEIPQVMGPLLRAAADLSNRTAIAEKIRDNYRRDAKVLRQHSAILLQLIERGFTDNDGMETATEEMIDDGVVPEGWTIDDVKPVAVQQGEVSP